jgi:Domain of unknown function (DUF4864)
MTHPKPHPSRLRSAATAWALLFAAILFGAVYATDMPQPADESGVQATVQRQLQAFAAEDAGSAFALADPGLRTRFGTAEEFLNVVRNEYPMVLRPISVLFLKPHSDGAIALQKVRMTDSEGSAWMVTYLLNRQRNDQWLISATLVEPDGMQVTI